MPALATVLLVTKLPVPACCVMAPVVAVKLAVLVVKSALFKVKFPPLLKVMPFTVVMA